MCKKIIAVFIIVIILYCSACAENIDTIICIGDSLTAHGEYASTLRDSITDGKKVIAFGEGSTYCLDMVSVQGGVTLYVDPFEIPADRKQVKINLFTDVDKESVGYLGARSTDGINPVIIDGIEGRITYDEDFSLHQYWFTRSDKGEPHSVTRPAIVHTYLNNFRNSILVIWLGTNDAALYKDYPERAEAAANKMCNYISQAISYNGNDKYIVLGLTNKPSNVIDTFNKVLASHFGYHFLDLKSYLVEYGLFDANITPTPKDLRNISKGSVPYSLLNDDVHFNRAGYEVIGKLIYNKGVELGYWK